MSKKNIEIYQLELDEVLKTKKELEINLNKLNVKSDELLLEINKTLSDIEKTKETELSLLQEIFIAKKNIIKNSISPSNIKDKFIRSKAFNDIKNTGKIILSTAQEEKNNIDKMYQEYKEKCIEKGENFKNRKEFQSLFININTIKNFDFSSILKNIKTEIKTIVDIAKEVHNENIEKSEIEEEKVSIDKNINKDKKIKRTTKSKKVPIITGKN